MHEEFLFLQNFVIEMNNAKTDEDVLALVIDKCIEYTGATSGTLMIISSDGYLDIRACRGFTDDIKHDLRLKVGEGITGWVAKNDKPYLCHDTENDPNYFKIKGNIRSEIAIPMLIYGKTIGVINLDSRKKNAFNDSQLNVLMILASSAVLIYKKIFTIDCLEIKVLSQNIVLEVAEILNVSKSLKEKFRNIMDILQERLLMRRGTIVLRRGDSDIYAIYTAVGLTDEEIKKGLYKIGEGITGRILKTGDSIAIKNIYEDKEFLDKTSARLKEKNKGIPMSFIGVPIKMNNDIVGVLSVDKPAESKKFDEEISLLKIIASFLAHAIQLEELSIKEKEELLRENAFLKEEVQSHYSFDQMVGISHPMLEIYKKIELVASSEATVLIIGESGTGKELVADAIHKRSKRTSGPMIKINCAAIPENLLESELFGHKKGAFTGAINDKKGRVVLADGGTLFLDEIGDMPLGMQTKLLRVIQNKEVDIIGGSMPIPINVRIIAATSRNLDSMIKDNTFREDLFYRLNVFRIDIPPLRQRREDIEMIAKHHLKKLAEREGVEFAGISYKALNIIKTLSLEGNVRELQNILERAFLIAGKGVIDEFHLNLPSGNIDGSVENNEKNALHNLMDFENPVDHIDYNEGYIYKDIIGKVERKLIDWALEKTQGNRSEAARFLGINRNTLNSKINIKNK